MRVKPTGEQLTQFNRALCSAYDYDGLRRLVKFAFDEDLTWFTPVARQPRFDYGGG